MFRGLGQAGDKMALGSFSTLATQSLVATFVCCNDSTCLDEVFCPFLVRAYLLVVCNTSFNNTSCKSCLQAGLRRGFPTPGRVSISPRSTLLLEGDCSGVVIHSLVCGALAFLVCLWPRIFSRRFFNLRFYFLVVARRDTGDSGRFRCEPRAH